MLQLSVTNSPEKTKDTIKVKRWTHYRIIMINFYEHPDNIVVLWPSHNGSTPESIEVSVTHSDHWQFKEWKDERRRVGDEKSTKDVFAWRVLCRGSGSVLWVIPFMFCCEKFKQQKYKEEHTPVCVWLANEASLKDVWAEPGSVSLQTTSYFPLTTNLEILTQCFPC